MEEAPLFRAPKRRKTTQFHDTNEEPLLPQRKEDEELSGAADEGEQGYVSKTVKLRKPFRNIRGGITFSTSSRAVGDLSDPTALMPADTLNDRPRDMTNRFVGSTGQVVDIDNHHMMAYIDSEMAKGRQLNLVTNHRNTPPTGSASEQHPQSTTQDNTTTQPQAHRLSEVDLSSLPTPSNQSTAKSGPRRPPRKPRLGGDGKPLRLRPLKRRNSEDLARDALVEQVLREHRLENVYQPPTTETGPKTKSAVEPQPGDASRDEVFAERFRQDFLDQIAERKQAQQQKKTAAAGAAVEKTQGPKLGGSRAARARMAATQQQGVVSGGQK